MLAYYYTITNNFNGKSFVIGEDLAGNLSCDSGKGVILQSYPGFELNVRNESQNKAGQHGIWDFFSFYGQRNITFQGLILASSHQELITIERLMKEVLSLPAQPIDVTNDGYINIKWTDDAGVEWNIDAKIQQDLQFSRELGQQLQASFFLNLKADDPYILSVLEQQQGERHGWIGASMGIPVFLPAKIETVYNNFVNIYQKGTAEGPATYTLAGPVTNPKITLFDETFSNNTLISDFTSGWVGGTDDTTTFQTASEAQKLTSSNLDPATMALTPSGGIDLSGGNYITGYYNVNDRDLMALGDYRGGENYIKFIENEGFDEFVLEIGERFPDESIVVDTFDSLYTARTAYYGFNEGAGTTAIDSQNGNDATITGATYVAGYLETALNFAATGDKVELDPMPTIQQVGADDSFVFKCRFKTSSTGERIIFDSRKSGFIDHFILIRMNNPVSDNVIQFIVDGISGGNTTITGGTAVNDGEWHTLVCIRNTHEDQLELYLDDLPDATPVTDGTTGLLMDSDSVMRIGRHYTGSGSTWVGDIDEVEFFEGAWMMSGDALNIVLDNTNNRYGTGAVSFDIDVTQTASDFAGIVNTALDIDIKQYKQEGTFNFDLFIPTGGLTNFTRVDVDLGEELGVTSYGKQIALADLIEGWNSLSVDWSGMTVTGSPTGQINQIKILMVYTAGYTDKTGFIVDNFKFYPHVEQGDQNEVRTDWNYFQALKDDFKQIGDPSWNDITKVAIGVKAKWPSTTSLLEGMEYNSDSAIQGSWFESDDADNPTIDITDKKEGLPAGVFPWTNSGGSGFWSINLPAIDISSFTGVSSGTPTSGKLGFWAKASDFTTISALQFHIGNDTSNRATYNYTSQITDNNWTYVTLDLVSDLVTVDGTPVWTSFDWIRLLVSESASANIKITGIRIMPSTQTAPPSLEVTFDDFNARDITFSTKKLELTTALVADDSVDFDVLAGTITKNDGTDLSGFLTLDSEWFFLKPRQNLLMYQSDLDPAVTNELPYVLNNPVIESGLIGYWNFDDEASVATDFANGNDGVIDPGVNYVDSSIRESSFDVDFDGVGGHITIPDNTVLQNHWDGGASVSFWINVRSDGSSTFGRIIDKDDLTSGWSIFVGAELSGLIKLRFLYRWSGSTALWFTTDRPVPLNTNIFCTMTYDASSPSNQPVFTVDRKVVAVTEDTAPVGTRKSDIGIDLLFGDSNGGGDVFDGTMSEIRMYDPIINKDKTNQLFTTPELNKYLTQVNVAWNDAIL